MPTLRYCPFCEREHKFHIILVEEPETFELWCDYTGIRVEKASKEEQLDRFLELSWQFVRPREEYGVS